MNEGRKERKEDRNEMKNKKKRERQVIQDYRREVYDKKFVPLVGDTYYRYSEGSDVDNKDDHSYRQHLFKI